MTLSFDTAIAMTTTTCVTCGISFGLPSDFLHGKRIIGGSFYCPNGHSLSFGKSEVDLLKEKLQQSQNALATEQKKYAQAVARGDRHLARADELTAELRTAENRVRGQKAANTRIKNRVANGVCPCCNRTFQNLQRHMKSQHPSFQQEEP